MYIYKIMYTSIKYLYIGILFSYLATVVIQFFINFKLYILSVQ